MTVRIPVAIAILIPASFFCGQHAISADQVAYEVAADRSAQDVLPAELLEGEHYRVDDRVTNDGYLNYYLLRSDYGDFDVASTAMLRVRIREVGALAELDEISKSEVFIKAAADAGISQVRTIASFATRPISTIKGLPAGIGRMFKRHKRQASDVVNAGKDYVTQDVDDSNDENKDYPAQAMSLTERYFGVSDSERAWAKELQTDPYTSNETLAKAVKEYAWADRLARTAVKYSGIGIPYVGVVAKVNDAVWGEDPYALRDRNRGILEAAGADDALIEQYLENAFMSPTRQTLITAAIEQLDGVANRDEILRQSLIPKTDAEAGYFVRAVGMVVWYHHHRKPLVAVTSGTAIPGGINDVGTAVLLFPSDYVYWTETIAAAANEYAANMTRYSSGPGEIWILGSVSDRARDELQRLGFELYSDFADTFEASRQ